MQPQTVIQAQLPKENANQTAKTEQDTRAKDAKEAEDANKVEKDKKEFDALLKKADKDDSKAQYKVGRCYKKGIGTAINKEKAFEYFLKSANQANKAALTSVGYCHLYGDCVEKNEQRGIDYLLSAAALNESCAENLLGNCYLTGHGVKKDYGKALQYFKLAAEHGDKEAPNNILRLEKALAEKAAAEIAKVTVDKSVNTSTNITAKADEKRTIQTVIREMIAELDADIAKNKKTVEDRSYIKIGSQFVASLAHFSPANILSKAVGGNKFFKVSNAEIIKTRLQQLLPAVPVNANTAAAPVQSLPAASAQAVNLENDIHSQFTKILDDFTKLDLVAGGGRHTLALIQKYRTEANKLNKNDFAKLSTLQS